MNEIVDDRMVDHQLDDCELTFHELREVVESFCFTLNSMLHRRIAYPKKVVAPTGSAVMTAAELSALRERERERVREVAPATARATT